MEQTDFGRKIFFLYPHSVVQDELLTELVSNEFEVYTLNSHERALQLLNKFPDAFIFVNIDEKLKEPEWEAWITKLRTQPEYARVMVGILSYNSNADLRKKYLMDVGVQCGYILLKTGIAESTRIVLETLKVNEAKGRRKYVRAYCGDDNAAMINFKQGSNLIYGKIRDLSIAGLAFTTDSHISYPPKSVVMDVQLRLRALLVRINCVYFGNRQDDPSTHVMLFDPKMDGHSRHNIHTYVRQSLQRSMDSMLL